MIEVYRPSLLVEFTCQIYELSLRVLFSDQRYVPSLWV